jgi:hypothetical protein
MSAFGKVVRPPVRRLTAPLLRALDIRLARTAERIEAHTVNLARHHEAINEQIVGAYNEGLNTTRALVRTEGEAVGEYVLAMARIEERLTRAIEMSKIDALPREVSSLDWPVADYLNWVSSSDGLLAGGGLFVNHAVDLRVEPGSVRVAGVNERVVELPHAHGLLAGRAAARVLDIGSHESVLALELASLGHHVVALDPRGYPFRHPNLTEVRSTVSAWRGPDTPFDAITCISAVEHFGIGAYALTEEHDADHLAMRRFADWLAADGELLLTVPFGRAERTALQRVYDESSLAALVGDFHVEQRHVYRRVDAVIWVLVGADENVVWSTEAPGVAVLRLRHR